MKIFYHLPGLFEFYDLYKAFLALFCEHREYFYDWCEIGSIYGAPKDCIWGGGRVGFGEEPSENVSSLLKEYGISARLTFSNSLLREEHLSDKLCNLLCRLFERGSVAADCNSNRDGETNPEREVIVTDHVEYVAEFKQAEGMWK